MNSGEFKAHPIDVAKVPMPVPGIEQMANDRAEADPLPGPLLNAFSPGAIKVAGHHVRKFVAYDHVLLKLLNSPLHLTMLELAKPEDKREEVKSTDQEEWDLCLQFTTPCKEVAGLIEKDVEGFHRLAKEQFGMGESSEVVKLILLGVLQQVANNILTGNKYAAEAKEANQITFLEPATG